MVIGQCVSGFSSIKDNHKYEIGKRKLDNAPTANNNQATKKFSASLGNANSVKAITYSHEVFSSKYFSSPRPCSLFTFIYYLL